MNIKKSTIIRTAVLVIVLLNTVLTMFGINPLPFSEEEVYEGVSAVVTVAASLWTWWENNSFTKAAIEADRVYDEIKAGEKETKENAESMK